LGVARVILVLTKQATASGPWYEYAIGAFVVSGLFLIIVLITKGRGMGGGDVKLMAAAGLLLGWKHILLAMMIGCILGSVIHIIRMNVNKKKEHVLAFGPYLAAGIYLTILFGNPIIQWYLGFFQKAQ
ncbi:MAG: prepilin peptidase, partial [Lachnospiraceae bacterium]|nr:prepilin peptidase [Lachnospiraceae bacterium]